MLVVFKNECKSCEISNHDFQSNVFILENKGRTVYDIIIPVGSKYHSVNVTLHLTFFRRT